MSNFMEGCLVWGAVTLGAMFTLWFLSMLTGLFF